MDKPCGLEGSSAFGARVQKVQRVQRVVVSPLRAMSMKSALRDWLSVSYGMKNNSADWLAALASPYPAAPDFPLFRGAE